MNWRWFLIAALLPLAACSSEESMVVGPQIAPSPTVTFAGADVSPGFVRIIWDVTDGTGHPFEIHRRLNERPWKQMFTTTTNVQGQMVLEDVSVQRGQTYSYRVRAVGVTTETYQGEVRIFIPVM